MRILNLTDKHLPYGSMLKNNFSGIVFGANGQPLKLKYIIENRSYALPERVLIEAKKGAKSGVKIPTPLIINNDDGTETEELREIYNKKKV